MKASDWIVDFLASRGIDVLYGYIGGMVTHLVDSASKNPGLHFVQTYHEQSAAFAAEGYARLKGKPGVAIATSGPGATNMLTGVANAYFDSIPVLYITGQVNTYEYKYDKPIRQQGFQETDVVSMAAPVTKYAIMIDRPERICYEFEKALYLAQSGRPGPVLIDLPMDIQRAVIDPATVEHYVPLETANSHPVDIAVEHVVAALRRAQRPILLIGGGCHRAENREVLSRLVHAGIPVVVSLQGKGAIPEDVPYFAGMLGSYGNRSANLAVARADLLVVLGSRLDTRQTGACRGAFGDGRRLIQIDIDAAEMEFHRLGNREVYPADLAEVLPVLAECCNSIPVAPAWQQEVAQLKTCYSQLQEVERFVANRLPYDIVNALNDLADPDTVYLADIGQNQMWAAQTLRLRSGQEFLTSGGMAPMGYAIPAAVGAAMACRDCRNVMVITGDGGLQIALQSLPLIAQYDLPVTVVVMNNESLGMITQFQQLYFGSNYAATTASGGYLGPRCELLAAAFGLKYHSVGSVTELSAALQTKDRSALIEVRTGFPTAVSPKLEYNKPFYDMSPALPEEELKRILDGDI